MSSFLGATAAGAAMLELDVQMGRDGSLILAHDFHVGSVPVSTLDERAARASGLALLDDVLEVLPAEVGLDIELKVPSPAFVMPLVEEVAALVGSSRQVLVSSFDPGTASVASEHFPSTALITRTSVPLLEALAAAAGLGVTTLVCQAQALLDAAGTPDWYLALEVARFLPGGVWVWDASPAQVPDLVALGALGLITDDVPGVLAALGSCS